MEPGASNDVDLSNYLSMVKRRWVPASIIFVSTLALSALIAASIKPSYQAEAKLLFKNSSFKVAGASLSPNGQEGEDAGDLKPLVATQNPIASQIEVIGGNPLLQKTIDKLKLKDDDGKVIPVKDLQDKLTLKIAGGTDVLKVMYKSPDPKEAARVVNTIVSLYLEDDIKTNQSEAEANRAYMDKQLPVTQAAVTQAEVALRNFKQKNNIVDLGEESKSAVAAISNIDAAINSTRAQLVDITAQSQQLQQKLGLSPQEVVTASAIGQSPAIQASLNQLQDIERQLATEQSRFSDTNPIISALKDKQANLSTLLNKKIQQTLGEKAKTPQGLLRFGGLKQSLIENAIQLEVQRSGLTQRLTSLNKSRADYERRSSVIPQLIQSQAQLQRKFEVTQATHQSLLRKVQELQLVKSKNTQTTRVIANATIPEKPETGARLVVMGFGLLLGGILSTGAIVFLEIRDRSLKTLKQIRSAFGYTLLGIIPSAPPKALPRSYNPAITKIEPTERNAQQSLTSEMSLMVQSDMRFSGTDKTLKTIIVTSSIDNEGKSKVAANLAAAIAQVGQSVLLIDTDLQSPYQHQFWKLPLKKGLSEVLTNQDEFKAIAWKVMDNLDVLTAGSKPSNPLACLDYNQMKSLLKQVVNLYDFVIVDTPPILVAADALILGPTTDGVLLVSRPGVIDDQRANVTQEKLKRANCNVLGIIVNGIT
jgi:capsular exopolysaccharide synthesis family protein